MDRRELLSLSGALAAALAGCSSGDRPSAGTQPTDTSTAEPSSGEPTVDDERLAELATDNARLALDLHAHLATEAGGNQFLSRTPSRWR